ncbi:MAG TPA: GlsB/YeaQ/YmgE family stress response membrane protein [Rubrivivax sp.]|nr:GlsB/YeaQ/YmgE family stress response membrane protein [Pseudomonadota bacterium]HOL36752.1 GlsB/YeaQ/YmgE family stress response membrane protein [Rubrivivax sp.]HPP82018.1 GlsB/YeaQ/YmgE family stress response membrane protein [Rubrivivax sp.]
MLHYLWIAIVGLVVGALARFVMPGEQKMGLVMTSLLGIAGSLIAGFVGQAVHWYEPGQPAGWIASVVGAVVLLYVVGKLKGGGGASR